MSRVRRASAVSLTLLMLAVALVAGCHDEPGAAPGHVRVTFGTPAAADLDLASVLAAHSAPPPPLGAEEQAILDQIVADPQMFFTRRPPAAVLNETELVFAAAGRAFELADHYKAAVDAGAVELRPRLAWIYERLGLHGAAVTEAERATAESPTSADAWFVMGFVLGQSEGADRALVERVRGAYARTLALDGGYLGPSGVTAADIREQISRLDAMLNPG
ncbi:MAG: tetratricopeptide repeat protein [Myxococcales bacterium]|nr:tetratricopeptide repeat protein [Myxococcales bacterium]MCB9532311.1 tetratricopeptide repeat protein [Myxococcales bacterium]MCB9533228.1 tetratricopeptide repeat protein [Myxococcales bacterium]